MNGGAMSVYSNATVTFIGTYNVMKSNTALIGKSIYSSSNNLKFTVCHPGDTKKPKTYTSKIYIEDDLEKCDASVTCTPIANKADAATVTCTSTTDSQLVGNCATGYWKDISGPADACKPQPECGNQLSGTTRLTGASLTAAGTCNSCAANTYAANNQTNCLANTVCGNLATGGTRSTGASRTAAGKCNSCADNTYATNDQENCVAHSVCGKQVGSSNARIATAGSPTTDTQCQACVPGTWGAATVDCQVCEDGKYNSKPVQPVCKDDCNAGSYILQDKSNCLNCPFGQWQNQNHQSSCIKCIKGKVLRLTNQISDKCEECSIGTYNPYEGHTGECLPCLTANAKGSIECEGW